ncbi:MAG TPA: DUF3108 domain-containing protein [Burkholderiaceae bacterium]|nr:DUF3108 domain-containing protein [Burkholderiaceae bacterium]
MRVICCSIAVVGWLASSAANDCAYAQSSLNASYRISLLGITVGHGIWQLEIDNNRYWETADARISGLASKLISGEGHASTQGVLISNRPQPTAFEADIKTDAEIDNITMMFDASGVTDLAVEPPLPAELKRQQVPVTDADRKGVLDPLTSLLIVPDSSDLLTPQACQNRIPVFDGRRRYDLALAFKRMDKLKTETGYHAVVVCSIHVTPVSGHRIGGSIAQQLIKSDGMEVALAPLPGTRILVPLQAAIPTALGTIWIAAERIVATDPLSDPIASSQPQQR